MQRLKDPRNASITVRKTPSVQLERMAIEVHVCALFKESRSMPRDMPRDVWYKSGVAILAKVQDLLELNPS